MARLRQSRAVAAGARAELSKGRVVLEAARRDQRRTARLLASSAASEADEDAAAGRLREAEEAVRALTHAVVASEADVLAARAVLEPGIPRSRPRTGVAIRAPIAGTVLALLQRGPGPVAPATPLLELGDPRSLELSVGVLTHDAVRAVRHPVARVDGWGGPPFFARIRRVDPSAYTRLSALGFEEQRVDVVLEPGAEEPVPTGLGDGFRVEVTLTTFAADEVIVAPASALFRRAEGWATFVVEEGRAQLRLVTLGERGDRAVEIVRGLGPGDVVIEHPGDRVREGTMVRAVEAER